MKKIGLLFVVLAVFVGACAGTSVPEVVLTLAPTSTVQPTPTLDVAPTLDAHQVEYQALLAEIENIKLSIQAIGTERTALSQEQQVLLSELEAVEAELSALKQQIVERESEIARREVSLSGVESELTSVTTLLVETKAKVDQANEIIIGLESAISSANVVIDGLTLELSASETLARSQDPVAYHAALGGFRQAIVSGHGERTGVIPRLLIGEVAVALGEEVEVCGLTFTVGKTDGGTIYVDPNLVEGIPLVKIVDRLSSLTVRGSFEILESEIQGYADTSVLDGANDPIQEFAIVIVNSRNDVFCREMPEGTLSLVTDGRIASSEIEDANSQITFFDNLVCVLSWEYNPAPTCQPYNTLG